MSAVNPLERRRALAGILGVSPALLVIGLFLIVPIIILAAYSLMQADPRKACRLSSLSFANPV